MTELTAPVNIRFKHIIHWDIVNNTPYLNEKVEMSMDGHNLGVYNSVTDGLIHVLEQEMGERVKVVHDYRNTRDVQNDRV